MELTSDNATQQLKQSTKSEELQKPYIYINLQDEQFVIVEVIDGYARGLVNLVKKSVEILNGILHLQLERIPAQSFNCYFSENLEISNKQVNLLMITITEKDKLLFETKIKI